jgi:hypothetical protein
MKKLSFIFLLLCNSSFICASSTLIDTAYLQSLKNSSPEFKEEIKEKIKFACTLYGIINNFNKNLIKKNATNLNSEVDTQSLGFKEEDLNSKRKFLTEKFFKNQTISGLQLKKYFELRPRQRFTLDRMIKYFNAEIKKIKEQLTKDIKVRQIKTDFLTQSLPDLNEPFPLKISVKDLDQRIKNWNWPQFCLVFEQIYTACDMSIDASENSNNAPLLQKKHSRIVIPNSNNPSGFYSIVREIRNIFRKISQGIKFLSSLLALSYGLSLITLQK